MAASPAGCGCYRWARRSGRVLRAGLHHVHILDHLSAREGRVRACMQGEWAGLQGERQARRGGVLTNEQESSLPQALSGLELPKLKPVAGVCSGSARFEMRRKGCRTARTEPWHSENRDSGNRKRAQIDELVFGNAVIIIRDFSTTTLFVTFLH